MTAQMIEVVNMLTDELNILLDAQTVEEALYGMIAYLNNGLKILYEVVTNFNDNTHDSAL